MEMSTSSAEMEMNETVSGSSNGLTSEERQILYTYRAHLDILNTVLSVLIIEPFGLLFNLVFLIVVVRLKSMRTILNVYLSNLAVADSCNLITSLVSATAPRDLASEEYTPYIVVSSGFQIASLCFVTAVAVERFCAVRDPLGFRAKASKARAAKISAGLWVLAIVMSVILTIYLTVDQEVVHLLIAICFFTFHVATLAITVLSYIYIVLKLRHQTTVGSTQRNRHRVVKVVRMLLINTVVFIILNSVQFVHSATLFTDVSEFSDRQRLLRGWVFIDSAMAKNILAKINNSINPLVYSLTNKDYRKALFDTFPFLNHIRRCLRQRLRLCLRRRRAQPDVKQEQIKLAEVPRDRARAQEQPQEPPQEQVGKRAQEQPRERVHEQPPPTP